MSEYKVVSSKPKPRLTSDKNTWKPCANEAACVEEINKVGILYVKSISVRSRPESGWERLKGPAYLRLWKEWARKYLQKSN